MVSVCKGRELRGVGKWRGEEHVHLYHAGQLETLPLCREESERTDS